MPREVTLPPTSPLVELVRASVIGDDQAMMGPYGPRRVTYADYTASGRALSFLRTSSLAAPAPPAFSLCGASW